MIPLPQRQQIVEWVEEANTAGARSHKACELLGIAPRTLQRWRQRGELLDDARSTRSFAPANKLSDQEREQIIVVANIVSGQLMFCRISCSERALRLSKSPCTQITAVQ